MVLARPPKRTAETEVTETKSRFGKDGPNPNSGTFLALIGRQAGTVPAFD
jgi:hypothetical protein